MTGGDLTGISDDLILRAATSFLLQRPSLKSTLLQRLTSSIDFEEPGGVSGEDLVKLGGVTVLVFSSWASPHIHCTTGAGTPWTAVPGLKMPQSKIIGFPTMAGNGSWFALRFPSTNTVEFLLNDGIPNQWQKTPQGGNFVINRSGVYIVKEGNISIFSGGATEVATPAKAEGSASLPSGAEPLDVVKDGGLLVLYKTGFPRPHLHYRTGTEPWTAPPGVAMQASSLAGFPGTAGWFGLHLPAFRQLEFVPNDGGNQWEKAAGNKNFEVPRPGAWTVTGGRLEQLGAAAAAPPAPVAKPSAAAAPEPSAGPALTQAAVNLLPADAPLTSLLSFEGVVLLYRSSWSSPHLHCRQLNDAAAPISDWTPLPGLVFHKASDQLAADLEDMDGGHGNLFTAWLHDVANLEFVINDGGPHYRWDKAIGGSNFKASTGAWQLVGGRLEKLQPPPAAPAKPEVVSVSRTFITIQWQPPRSVDGVRGYRIYRDGALVATLSAGLTKYTDSGLLANHQHSYAVAGLSPQGMHGSTSEAVTATTDPVGKPGLPEGLKVARATGKAVELEWAAPKDNGGALITAYIISRGGKVVDKVLAPGSGAVASADEKCSWTDTQVKRGAKYTYTVAACHLPPPGELREKVLKTRQATLAPEMHDPLLDVPEEVNMGDPAGPIEAEAMDELETDKCLEDLRGLLQEQALEGGRKGPRGITVFFKAEWNRVYAHACARPEIGWTKPPGVKMVESPCTSFPAEEGWWVLRLPFARSLEFVLNDGGNQWDKAPGGFNYKAVVPGVFRLSAGHLDPVAAPPQAPTGLAGKALDGSRVSLTWQAPPLGPDEAPVAHYKVFRNGRLCGATESSVCTFTDKNLFAFTDYEYSVAAVNSQEVAGPLSTSAGMKTELPGPPTEPRNLRAATRNVEGKLSVILEWEPPVDCGGAPVASYEILRNGVVVSCFDVPNARLRSEAEAARPVDPEAKARRWVRSTCSYSNLSWFKDALEYQDTGVKMGETYHYQVRAVQLGPERATELKAGGLVQRCGSRFLDNVLPDVIGPACEPVEVRAVPFLDPPKMGDPRTIIMFQGFDWVSWKDGNWYGTLMGLLPELRTAGINLLWLPPPSQSVDEHGYLPSKWYLLDSHYGKADQLQRLIGACHEQGIWPMLDVVVNHRCASAQDTAGRWLKFEEPDWEAWAVCCNSPAVPGGTGAQCSGEPAQYAPSVDHSNPRVRNDVNAFLRYMMEEVGFKALRFDFSKGYSPAYQRDYVKAAGSPFSVAENWNGDTDGLHQFVRECQGQMAVFDFAHHYILKRAIQSNNYEELNVGGKPAGIMGRDPARSVPFIENHDTYQLACCGGPFGNEDQVLRAYACILTHPGTPCVFIWDYTNKSGHFREKLLALCSIRRDANIHSTSSINICAAGFGIYAAIIDNKVAVKLGTQGWSPGDAGWEMACAGSEFAVWRKH